MHLLKKVFGNHESGSQPKGNSATSREVFMRTAGDPPVVIDPHSITAAFVALTLEDARHLDKAEKAIADLNRHCQPRLWSVPFTTKFGAFACSAAEGGLPDVRGVAPALEKQGLILPFSLVVNTMTVSLDGGRTKAKILVGFAFRDKTPRVLFPGNDGCVPG